MTQQALNSTITIWLVEGHSGWPLESFAIALILPLNTGLGVYQESKAEAALARLKALAESLVWVRRDGRLVHLPSTEIVPGDVVRVEAGDRVPADGNVISAEGVMVDESVLTGESLPIEKLIADELLSGTLLTRGKTYMEVSCTGAASAARFNDSRASLSRWPDNQSLCQVTRASLFSCEKSYSSSPSYAFSSACPRR